jgi:hypothetical protein
VAASQKRDQIPSMYAKLPIPNATIASISGDRSRQPSSGESRPVKGNHK